MNSRQLVEQLRDLKFDNTFNPYAERCPVYDVHDAPKRRSQTLLDVLESATKKNVHSMWIGRDLGHRGGRRTGLALTDDRHSSVHAARWEVSIQRPTTGEVVIEQTATVIWNVLARLDRPIFLWNVFPLHPHKADNPFSNRPHNSLERDIGESLLAQLILLLRPQLLVGIGIDASNSVRRLAGHRHEVFQVRHPSYGGQRQFVTQMHRLYDLKSRGVEVGSFSMFRPSSP